MGYFWSSKSWDQVFPFGKGGGGGGDGDDNDGDESVGAFLCTPVGAGAGAGARRLGMPSDFFPPSKWTQTKGQLRNNKNFFSPVFQTPSFFLFLSLGVIFFCFFGWIFVSSVVVVLVVWLFVVLVSFGWFVVAICFWGGENTIRGFNSVVCEWPTRFNPFNRYMSSQPSFPFWEIS